MSGSPGYQAGLQRHHLLPRQLLSQKCFGKMFDAIGRHNVGFDDFRVNGMLLPCREETAIKTFLPLHRGPHHGYNKMVIERVGRIEQNFAQTTLADPEQALEEALFRLSLLQKSLRKRLLADRRRLMLNRNDPIGTGFDFTELDAMAERLWMET